MKEHLLRALWWRGTVPTDQHRRCCVLTPCHSIVRMHITVSYFFCRSWVFAFRRDNGGKDGCGQETNLVWFRARNIHHDFLLFERLWQCIVRCFERPRSMSRFWICPQSIHNRSYNDIKDMINDHLDERAPCGFQGRNPSWLLMVWARCQLFANTANHVHVPGPAKVSNEDLSLGVEPHCARAQIPKFRV